MARKRLSEAQKAREARRQTAKAEAKAAHPGCDEVQAYYYGNELHIHVWKGGKNVAHYRDRVDPVEAAYTGKEALTR